MSICGAAGVCRHFYKRKFVSLGLIFNNEFPIFDRRSPKSSWISCFVVGIDANYIRSMIFLSEELGRVKNLMGNTS